MVTKRAVLAWVLALSLPLLGACGGGGGGGSTGSSSDPAIEEPAQPVPPVEPEPQIQHLAGGDATVREINADAFSDHSANMDDIDRIKTFNLGDDFFQNPWVAGSASTSSRDGLGGLFNNNACQDCHIRDGRGHAPQVDAGNDGTNFSSILIRAARTDIDADDESLILQSLLANVLDSSVGGQLQQDSVAGVTTEANLRVSYEREQRVFDDGTVVELRRPRWHFESVYAQQGYDFNLDTAFSARVAPPMIGMGLLELIPEADILANEDAGDSNGDGISGRANWVQRSETLTVELGRFGWRAGQPTVLEQSAAAFVNDMGLTSRLHQQESCLPHQADCLATPNGNGDSTADYDYEVSDTVLDAVGFYAAHLAVPVRRDAYSEQVQRGQALFEDAGCGGCHVQQYRTGASVDHPELGEQDIFPYTDLLLHDMGEDLADFTLDNETVTSDTPVEFLATAREWRTPPLWGIGLTHAVDPEATFLHDGRARTLMEAILWHGGEAEGSRDQVLSFDEQERDDLLAFLNDL